MHKCGNVNVIVDWEYAGIGDPIFDIAKFELSFIEQHANKLSVDKSILIKKFRKIYRINETQKIKLIYIKNY